MLRRSVKNEKYSNIKKIQNQFVQTSPQINPDPITGAIGGSTRGSSNINSAKAIG